MSLQIVLYPHPVLRRPCETVRQVKKTLRLQIGRMFELMYAAKGIGLAAPQVGISQRILLINLSGNPGDAKSERVLINPVFTARNGLAEEREGCLSLPGLYAPVRRATTVSFQALDLDGKEIRGTFRGLEARALQHEIDHLEGILFIDRLPALRLAELKPALQRFEAEYCERQSRASAPRRQPPSHPATSGL